MVRLTLIARREDGLPLAEGLDNDKDHDLEPFKHQAKVRLLVLSAGLLNSIQCSLTETCTVTAQQAGCPHHALQQLFKKMAATGAPASRASLESGPFTFHYLIDGQVTEQLLNGTGSLHCMVRILLQQAA